MTVTLRRILCLLIVVALAAGWQAESVAPESPAAPPTGTPGAGAATPSTAGPTSIPSGARMAVVQIEGGILYAYQFDSLQARVDRAVAGGADVIVFEIDTPGGRLDLALKIAKYIKSLQVRTVAWVHPTAYSAGSLIATACDEMVMSRNSATGDCAPIAMGQNLAATERAKALSPLLAEFRDNAAQNYAGASGSDYAAFHAMCVLGIPVYKVRHTETGEVRLVNAVDLEVLVNDVLPNDALDLVEGSSNPAAAIASGGNSGASQSGGSYAGTENLDLRQVAGPSLVIGNDQQRGKWELVEQVHDGGTLLTVSDQEAAAMGLSRATVSSMAELKQHYNAADVYEVKPTWSEAIAWFLIHPWVRGVLVLLLLVGGFLEYVSPGLILPGTVAGIALVLLIGAPYVIGLASIWHIVVVVLGLMILIFELVTLSTGGILVIVGLAMILVGLALAAVQSAPNGLPAAGTADQLLVSALSMGGGLIIAVPAFILIVRYFGELPGLKRLVLEDESAADAVNSAGEPINAPEQRVTGDEAVGAGWVKVGMTGTVTRTGLRPTGRVEIDDKLIDVTSTGGWVEAGTAVTITEVHGNVVVVEAVEEA
ncbi:hypothetical protein OT109_09955 [Phycisphaeraceae bacterium D3-23]